LDAISNTSITNIGVSTKAGQLHSPMDRWIDPSVDLGRLHVGMPEPKPRHSEPSANMIALTRIIG